MLLRILITAGLLLAILYVMLPKGPAAGRPEAAVAQGMEHKLEDSGCAQIGGTAGTSGAASLQGLQKAIEDCQQKAAQRAGDDSQ